MRKLSFIYSIMALTFLLGLAACSASKKGEKVQVPNIKYKKWSLQQVAGIWVDSTTAKTAYVIFNSDGTMGGNTGCNSFGGNYLIAESNHIVFSSTHVTEMYCNNNLFEKPLLSAINKINKFSIEDKKLILWNDDERLIVFTPPAR